MTELDALVENIARRVVELLHEEPRAPCEGWLDPASVAARFGVSRSWVYDHADKLGAVRLGEAGDGRKPRLRFDPLKVAAFLERQSDEPPVPPPAAPRQRRGGHASATLGGAPLLEIRGNGGAVRR